MSATAAEIFPHIDARTQDCITDEQAKFFIENGLLILRNVVHGEELRLLQDETQKLVDRANTEQPNDPDYFYKPHEITHKKTPFRVEYVIQKCTATKALLGHPFILRSVEKLQGRNFVPTWDSMVFKNGGMGVAIPWHRDSGTDHCHDTPIFNVDFYLDQSDLSNCLWGIPGSNRWSAADANATIKRLNTEGFKTEGAVPIQMNAGDVIFHNILALHGSPPAQSKLRRVIYYEFRAGETEKLKGPHTPEYIPLKQRVLLKCLEHRAQAAYLKGEKPFVYNPSAEFTPAPFTPGMALDTYRFPHGEFWRTGDRK